MTLAEAYRTLGIDPVTAQRDQVTKRYRDLVKRMHPDVRDPSERERATEDLQRINGAYAAIRESGFRTIAPMPPPPQAPPPAGFGSPFPYGNPYGPQPAANPYGGPPFNAPPFGYGYAGAPQADRRSPPGAGFGPGSGPIVADQLAFARRYAIFDGLIGRSSGWFTLLLMFAFVRSIDHGIFLVAGIAPLLCSLASWGVSTRGRHGCWQIVRAMLAGVKPELYPAYNAQLRRSATFAIGGYIAALGFVGFMLFAR